MASKHLHIGPGGMKCSCCFPGRGTRSRKLAFRAAKRKDTRESIRYEAVAEGDYRVDTLYDMDLEEDLNMDQSYDPMSWERDEDDWNERYDEPEHEYELDYDYDYDWEY
jgi:hypothetical protein